ALLLMKLPVQMFMSLLFLTHKGRQETDSIDIFRNGSSCSLGQGGQNIPKGGNVVCLCSCFNFSRPSGDHRCTDAAFIQIPFIALEGAVAVKEVRIRTSFYVGSVVGSKNNQGIFR